MALLRTMASRAVARMAPRVAAPALSRRSFMSSVEDYGSHVFKGAVADHYLAKQGLPAGLLDDPTWTSTSADKVSAQGARVGRR